MTHAIECESVTFRYAENMPNVLDDFNISIPIGSVWLIEGNNGVGKSTLIRLMAGLIHPLEGCIARNAKSIEYLHQDYQRSLFPWKSVAWNICSPRIANRKTTSEGAERYAQDLVDQLGINIPVAEYPFRLSGGQAHLVTLLRAFAAEPELLLLDEPATGLSQVNSSKLWEALNWFTERNPQMTTICVSHDQSDRAFNCQRLQMVGTPAVVKSNTHSNHGDNT